MSGLGKWERRERLWRKRAGRVLLAAAFWTMFGWLLHDGVSAWLGREDGDDGPQVEDTLRTGTRNPVLAVME